jgi:hypothetical protein
MALLDFIKEHQQSQTPNVDRLPESVKGQALEAARPAAETMGKGAEPKSVPAPPTSSDVPSRGRGPGMER